MLTSKKYAFTLAETIMTLFIVGLVITAAIPIFTQKRSLAPTEADVPWSICNTTELCSATPIVIGANDKISASDSLSINSDADKSLFDVFQGDKRRFGFSEHIIEEAGTNLYISKDSYNTDNENNVIIGNNPSINNVQLSNSIILGNSTATSTNANTTALQNNIVFGNSNKIDASSSLIFGEENKASANASGNTSTLIGTNNEASASSFLVGNGLRSKTANYLAIGDYIYGTSNSALVFNTPSLQINGTFAGIMTITTTITSDERLKNIKSFYKKGLNEILQINPVVFIYKKDREANEQVGVIAQDLQKVFPEAVVKMPSGYLGVDTAPIFFAMVNAMQEVNQTTQKELDRQKQLESDLALLENELKELTACKAKDFWGKIECIKADLKRFLNSFDFANAEVSDEV